MKSSSKRKRITKKSPAEFTAKDFFLEDASKTLFPLRTNRILVESGFDKLITFVRSNVPGDAVSTFAFLPQRRVSALKNGWHLRRTVKLDPVAEIFLYDLVYRNRSLFKRARGKRRESFGYVFSGGRPIDATSSYRAFKGACSEYNKKFNFSYSFDVASYFNSIYHHDLRTWLEDRGANRDDVEAFGKFLRETNAGRSIDCLPQGLYPSKMIGSDFLRFIDESIRVKSEILVRFMDDMVLFGDDRDQLLSDFYVIQDLLGQKGLSVNPSKSSFSDSGISDIQEDLDEVRRGLLQKRRTVLIHEYDEDSEEEIEEIRNLSESEIAVLKEMLSRPQLEEHDIELVLALMGEHSSDVLVRLNDLMREFPNLAKNIYIFCRHIRDKHSLATMVLNHLKSTSIVPEYQLFWIGMMLEDHLLGTREANEITNTLFHHAWATPITKAKVLEIPDKRYGLPELRDEQLKGGNSDWLAWSAAVGTRKTKRATRNYVLKYFKNASPINRIISEIISDLP